MQDIKYVLNSSFEPTILKAFVKKILPFFFYPHYLLNNPNNSTNFWNKHYSQELFVRELFYGIGKYKNFPNH